MNAISFKAPVTKNTGHVLVISSSNEITSYIKKNLEKSGVSTVVAKTVKQAFNFLSKNKISFVLVDTALTDAPCCELIRSLRVNIGEQYIPIIILASTDDEEKLSYCMSAGCDDVLFKPFTSLALKTRISSLDKIRDLQKLYAESLNEQVVAKRILTNAIDERSIHFEEIGFLSRSKAIFSGDLFLTARHPDGSLNILLADFTGHGLSAAMGALPVADTFRTMTEKGFEPDYILENINGKLHTLLPTSMFMACIVINISNDLKHARIWNGGMPDIYIREHESGRVSYKIESSHMPLGIIEATSDQYRLKTVDITQGDQLILFTDGLTESLNEDSEMFGQQRLEECLQNNNKDKSVFVALVNSFNEFCGDIEPMDDVTLACIPCISELMQVNNTDVSKNMQIACSRDNSWYWYIELGGSNLRETNPVPNIIGEIRKIYGASVSTDELSNIMSVLYENAIEHGEPVIDQQGTNVYKINKSHSENSDAYIRVGIKKIHHNGIPALLVQIEDSGKAISQSDLLSSLDHVKAHANGSHNNEPPLIYELNKLSLSKGSGNRLEAIICEHNRTGE